MYRLVELLGVLEQKLGRPLTVKLAIPFPSGSEALTEKVIVLFSLTDLVVPEGETETTGGEPEDTVIKNRFCAFKLGRPLSVTVNRMS